MSENTISKIKLPGSVAVYDIKDSALTNRVSNLETTISSSLQKGVANGIAELDSTGKVPSSQLPSYVDDVLEYSNQSSFPATGETGKIYIALDTNKTYRWSGSAYTEISASLALGETSSTAYRGDRGKTAYDHSQTTSGNPHNVTKSDIGLGNVDNTSDATKKTNFTGSIASGNTGFVTGGDAYTAISAKYTKPSTGIPASDLASGVIPSVPSATTTTPKMNGTAAAGSETKWAKGDHVHPTDTSRQATITASGVLIGNGSGGVSSKTLDTSSLTNDTNHVPTSSVVKTYADSKITYGTAALTPGSSALTTGTIYVQYE